MTGVELPQQTRSNHFPFFELPVELQQRVLRFFFTAWNARLEVHEKPKSQALIDAGAYPIKSTTRIWSSNIVNMLDVALTCKTFRDFVYASQRDPTLFSGELDLVEANGDLNYVLGRQSSFYQYDYCRTAVFLKQGAYPRGTKDAYHTARRRHHDDILDWVVQNTGNLSLYADEIVEGIPWSRFATLKSVTLYHPFDYLLQWYGTGYLCDMSRMDACEVVQKQCRHLYRADHGWEVLTSLDVDIFVKIQATHMHLLSYEQEDKFENVEVVKEFTIEEEADMVLICTVRNGSWSFCSSHCQATHEADSLLLIDDDPWADNRVKDEFGT